MIWLNTVPKPSKMTGEILRICQETGVNSVRSERRTVLSSVIEPSGASHSLEGLLTRRADPLQKCSLGDCVIRSCQLKTEEEGMKVLLASLKTIDRWPRNSWDAVVGLCEEASGVRQWSLIALWHTASAKSKQFQSFPLLYGVYLLGLFVLLFDSP